MLKIRDKKLYMVSFAVPIAVMLAVYISNGIMTEYSILINDLSGQYSSFLLYYRNHLAENGIFYSFSKGLGGNFFGIFTYYLTSPLNLIVFLFPSHKLELAVLAIILLRFGLSSVTFSWFIQHICGAEKKALATVFGIAYALSSYMVVLCYHLLWGDVYFMLPLIIGFMTDIFKGKSPRNFIIAFSFMIISNYYMAYMVGIFCALLFVHHCISTADAKQRIKSFADLAKGAAISVGLTAWLLVPTVFALLQGKFTIPDDRTFAFELTDMVKKLFIAAYDNVGNLSAPYVYCGAAALILFCTNFFVKEKKLRGKLADLFMVAVLFLSFWYVPLNKVWHMFAAPNAFPYRFTFIAVFFILWKGCEGCCAQMDKAERRCFAAFAGTAVWAMVFAGLKFTDVPSVKIAVTVILAISVIILVMIYKITGKKIVILLLSMIITGDMALNAYSLMGENYTVLEKYPAGVFEQNYLAVQQQLDAIEEDGFYRVFCTKNEVEGVVDYTENTGFRHGFNEMYRAFTSLTENEYEAFRRDVMSPVDKDIVRVAMGTKYRMNKQEIKVNEETVFPVIYKTPVRPQLTDNLVQYIEEVTGQYVLTKDGEPDSAALDAAGRIARANGAESFVQNRNKITAIVNSDTDNQFVATSIVWDDGWTIKVNGQKKTKHRVLNNLMGFYVHSGENVIEMTYIPKGFYPAVALSVFTLVCCMVYCIYKKKNR